MEGKGQIYEGGTGTWMVFSGWSCHFFPMLNSWQAVRLIKFLWLQLIIKNEKGEGRKTEKEWVKNFFLWKVLMKSESQQKFLRRNISSFPSLLSHLRYYKCFKLPCCQSSNYLVLMFGSVQLVFFNRHENMRFVDSVVIEVENSSIIYTGNIFRFFVNEMLFLRRSDFEQFFSCWNMSLIIHRE